MKSKLQNVVIIVILPYDPFGYDRMVYTVKNGCVEEPIREQATREGLTEGIIALIETCREFDATKEETVERIMKKQQEREFFVQLQEILLKGKSIRDMIHILEELEENKNAC